MKCFATIQRKILKKGEGIKTQNEKKLQKTKEQMTLQHDHLTKELNDGQMDKMSGRARATFTAFACGWPTCYMLHPHLLLQPVAEEKHYTYE